MLAKLNINNPGNIRKVSRTYPGEVIPSSDPAFKEFKDMESGYQAMFSLLNRFYFAQGQDTIKKIIFKWAPPSENNSQAYVNSIVSQTGINQNTVIDKTNPQQMQALVSAMSRHENGSAAVAKEVSDGWKLFEKEIGLRKTIITGTIVLFGVSALITTYFIIKSINQQ